MCIVIRASVPRCGMPLCNDQGVQSSRAGSFIGSALRMTQGSLRRISRRRHSGALPRRGFPASAVGPCPVDELRDSDLEVFNSLLEWNCFSVDSNGRRVGSTAWGGKRSEPQEVPDRRILDLDSRIDLASRSVLEIGCFEGIHTIGLASRGASVTGVDARVENVVKTIVRSNFYGFRPEVLVCDVESDLSDVLGGRRFDVIHHVGVLYHLKDPVQHLFDLAQLSGNLMLDTHVARSPEVDSEYTSNGWTVPYRRYSEHGRRDVFSGMYDHAKWLTLPDLVDVLESAGFRDPEVAEVRQERNGERVLIFAGEAARR